MRVVRHADWRHMPWKNGGGTTAEIAVYPEGAGLDDFEWRVSAARVEQDGPFSMFPDVDRTLTVLDGDGLELTGVELQPVRLDTSSAPCSFPADIAVSARLLGGPVLDFNVMTRRSRAVHRVERLHVSGRHVLRRDGVATLVHNLAALVAARWSRHQVSLQRRDTLVVDGPGEIELEGETAALLIVRIARR